MAIKTMLNRRAILMGIAMLVAAALSYVLTPSNKAAHSFPQVDLASIIPKQFGDWRIDESIIPLQVAPDVQAKLIKIYNQTLSRTYVNKEGYRIMLSLAYGDNQTDSMQVHLPDICYPSQGYGIMRSTMTTTTILGKTVPVKRLVAARGVRNEPITYWIRLGEKVALGMFARKKEQIRMAMKGGTADGLLFRVSSIDQSDTQAYQNQDRFIKDLLENIPTSSREFILGKATLESH